MDIRSNSIGENNPLPDLVNRSHGAVSRRELLQCSALLAATIALPARLEAQSGQRIADVHVHLFNAADLPIEGFARYVLLPQWLAEGLSALALLDLFAFAAKNLSRSASRELRNLGGPVEAEELTPEEFGRRVAEHIEDVAGNSNKAISSDVAESSEIAQSYRELTTIMAADAGYGMEMLARARSAPSDRNDAFRGALNAYTYTVAARKADDETLIDPGIVAGERAAMFGGMLAENRAEGRAAWTGIAEKGAQMVGWIFLMAKTRRGHLDKYLRTYRRGGFVPELLVNHLVDYDLWLDDAPRRGSEHLAQLELYARLAENYRDRVDLRTFAGLCPLKLAIERRRGGQVSFDRIKPLAETGKVFGFKLYPPMGFRAFDNTELADDEFDPGPRGRRTALDRWRAVAGEAPLGEALDAALTEIYSYCADRSLPLMAHAGSGNGAGNDTHGGDYGQRADPIYWEKVAQRFPIRISLGHMVNDAAPFVRAVNGGTSPHDVWALHASRRMLRPDSGLRGEVYGDLGFMPELIYDPALNRDFFVALKNVFGAGDPDMTRVMLGSDWIMFASRPRNKYFVETVDAGMRAAGYSDLQRENILHANARRFLRI